ncbi:hypothetical protein HK104_005789, partial [Borealophlyctis nickersoniae]
MPPERTPKKTPKKPSQTTTNPITAYYKPVLSRKRILSEDSTEAADVSSSASQEKQKSDSSLSEDDDKRGALPTTSAPARGRNAARVRKIAALSKIRQTVPIVPVQNESNFNDPLVILLTRYLRVANFLVDHWDADKERAEQTRTFRTDPDLPKMIAEHMRPEIAQAFRSGAILDGEKAIKLQEVRKT